MNCPEKRLYLAIVKQAVKDFHAGCRSRNEEIREEKKVVKKWVIYEEGTFPLCSIAWSTNPDILKEKLLITFQRIENGERPF